MAVIHFNKEGFDKAAAQGAPMLVDFWATWCGPCKMLAPTVEKLAEHYDGKVIVGKVDVDDEPELAQRFGVMSIPTLVVLKDGKEAARTVGVQPQSAIEHMVDSVL
jgi:thioredoxin 1